MGQFIKIESDKVGKFTHLPHKLHIYLSTVHPPLPPWVLSGYFYISLNWWRFPLFKFDKFHETTPLDITGVTVPFFEGEYTFNWIVEDQESVKSQT